MITLHLNLLVLVIEFDTLLQIDKLLLTTELNIFRDGVDLNERSEGIVASVKFDPVDIDPVGLIFA
jgi:hypothetical protein